MPVPLDVSLRCSRKLLLKSTALSSSVAARGEELITDIRSNFFGDHGDRHQELVFIGQELDQQRIENILDRCLLTDLEFVQGPGAWSDLEAPLPLIETETEDIA